MSGGSSSVSSGMSSKRLTHGGNSKYRTRLHIGNITLSANVGTFRSPPFSRIGCRKIFSSGSPTVRNISIPRNRNMGSISLWRTALCMTLAYIAPGANVPNLLCPIWQLLADGNNEPSSNDVFASVADGGVVGATSCNGYWLGLVRKSSFLNRRSCISSDGLSATCRSQYALARPLVSLSVVYPILLKRSENQPSVDAKVDDTAADEDSFALFIALNMDWTQPVFSFLCLPFASSPVRVASSKLSGMG
mmetsp:Transcript_16/g.58  ORF Transcript_16/g.58 Transcript_16/m.58 type:complete len:248 (-) Transcript_16:522-1265(-)